MIRTDALIKNSLYGDDEGNPVYFTASFDVSAETKLWRPTVTNHLGFIRDAKGLDVAIYSKGVVVAAACTPMRDVSELVTSVSKQPEIYEVFDGMFLLDLSRLGLTRESYVALVQEAVKQL